MLAPNLYANDKSQVIYLHYGAAVNRGASSLNVLIDINLFSSE